MHLSRDGQSFVVPRQTDGLPRAHALDDTKPRMPIMRQQWWTRMAVCVPGAVVPHAGRVKGRRRPPLRGSVQTGILDLNATDFLRLRLFLEINRYLPWTPSALYRLEK